MIKFKKLYEANSHWNGCKLQLHCKNLEWVNTRSKKQNKTSLLCLFKETFIDKYLRTAHWVGY